MAVTLLNVFIVPEELEEEFLTNWKKSCHVFSHTPGFIETHLHRNTGVGNGTFRFINIARWESADAWHSSHAAHPPTEYAIPGVKGHPAIFESIIDVEYQGDRTDIPAGRTEGDFIQRLSAN
jgi:heme-degrading monooxygenase HmoA